MLQTTGAGLAGAGLSAVSGSASAAGINLPPLARDMNQIVDPQGDPVKLAGVSIADPGESSRSWRGLDAEGVVELATGNAGGDFSNTMIRVPMQAEFIYTGSGAASGPGESDLPHGDDWGPAMPGTYDQSQLEGYLNSVIDPLVELGQQYGAYIMLDYHRHYPVFHHTEQEEYVKDGQPIDDACYDDLADDPVWYCDSAEDVDHTQIWNSVDASQYGQTGDFAVRPESGRYADACGERGILWHGADQIDEVRSLAEEQNYEDNFEGIDNLDEDLWTETPEFCNALDAELTLFWETVTEMFGDQDHVIFDIYNEPTGPYAGDWGHPERKAGELSDAATASYEYDLWGEYSEPYHELWYERSAPWVQTVEDGGQGQVKTIGNPRWSQYVYWSPYYEYDVENMAYTSHVYLQDNARPLEDTVGTAAEVVPVFFSEFGWMDFNLTVPTPWMTRDQAGLNWWEGETDPTGGLTFQAFIDQYDVHPVCWAFDHTWEPNFFEHGAPGGGECRGTEGAPGGEDWHNYLIEEDTPGGAWQQWVNDHVANSDMADPASGSTAYDGVQGPNNLTTGNMDGYALPHGEEPAPGSLEETSSYYGEGPVGDCEDVPTETVDGQQVCDIDDDPLFEDVNGDGDLGQDDVAFFFERQHRPAWDQPDLFDFSGNGSIGHGDVVALFEEAAL